MRKKQSFPNLFIVSIFMVLILASFQTRVYAHAGHDSSVLIPLVAPEGLSTDFINALVKPVLPVPDVEEGKVHTLDTPWLWPSLLNGSTTMNTVHSTRTDSDGDGLKECRYFYKLDTMSAKYTSDEITALENGFDRAFELWNTTINQLGLEFKRVTAEGDAHMLVKSVSTLGSGTPAQASLFGAFFYSGVSPMVPELLVNENYTNFGNFSDLVIGSSTKIKVTRPPGNPYVNVVSYWDLSKTSTVNSVDYTRNDPVFRTAIHEIGHLMGLNHTFDGLQKSAQTSSTEYMVDWLAYTDIGTAYTSMSLVNSYDGENPLTSGAVRGLNNSFMTYDERSILSYMDITPHQKAAMAFIYRDVKGDSRASAAALLKAAKAEYDKYNTFRNSRVKCEVEKASATVTTNNTLANAMSISIGDSVLGSISSWASTANQTDSAADTGDYYSFTVSADMVNKPIYFDIDFGSTMFASKLEILNASDSVLSAEPASSQTMWDAATQWKSFSGGQTYPDPGSYYDKHPTQSSSMNVPDPFIVFTPTAAGTYYAKVTRNSYLDANAGGQAWPSAWGDYYLRTSLDAVTAKPTVTCAEGTSFTTATPTINWTTAANASEYIFEYRKQGTTEWTRDDTLGTAVTKKLSLTENAAYEVRVMGYNPMNQNLATTPWSDTLTVTKTDASAKYKLTVNITPASAVQAGVKWKTSLDSSDTWRDSGTYYEMTAGTKITVTIKQVRGWLIDGGSYTSEYTQGAADYVGTVNHTADTPHTLTVSISSAAAVSAGAKWRLTAPTGVAESGFYDWKTSGSSLNLYNKEAYTIEFGTATGFTSPSNATGTMGTSNVSVTTGSGGVGAYSVITHNLTVNITPAEAVTAGAQWQLATDGATWRNSGTSAALGENTGYTVSFKSLTGYTKPANQTGTLTTADVTLSGAYTVDAAPTFSFTAPGSSDVTANTTYTITWTDADADSSANISLYLDKTSTWQGDGSEILLLSGISEDADGTDDLQDKLILSNTSSDARKKMKDIPAGKYYVLAVIDDSNHASPTRVWSTGKLIVDHSGTITEVTSSNIKSTTASITYVSTDSGTAVVNYSLSNGSLDSTANDTRGASNRIIHNVALTGLTANTAYKYNAQLNLATAYEGMNTFKNDNVGENYTFTTALAAQTRVPAAYTVTGKILDEQGSAVNEALVVISIAAAADSGTANQGQTSHKLSVLTGADGAFSFDLANLAAPDGDGFLYAANDTISLKANAGTKGVYEGTYTLGSSTPQDLQNITVRTQYKQSLALKAGFNLVSFPLDFSAAPVTARSLFSSYSALAAVYSWNPSTQSYSSTIKADATTVIGDAQSITPGVGYWIKASSDVTIEVTGKILTTPAAINLKTGFNLVGFACGNSYPSSLKIAGYQSTDPQSGADTSYKDFINSITDGQGKAASAIYCWNTSTSSYDGVLLLNNEPYLIKTFPVELIKAYFIKVVRDVTYTPAK